MGMTGGRGFEVEMRASGIALVTFNQPDRLNTLSQSLKRDLVETIHQAQLDGAVRVVVFTGSGRAFCAGDDVGGGFDAHAEPLQAPALERSQNADRYLRRVAGDLPVGEPRRA